MTKLDIYVSIYQLIVLFDNQKKVIMTMHPQTQWKIPPETERITLAVFKKPNLYVTIAQKLGQIYEDVEFQSLFSPNKGQSAISPARLALITIFQYLEGLTDRQTAEAVKARIDWKYALALELTDEGFDFSVLSEWRGRLINDGQSEQLLNKLLIKLQELHLVKKRGKQRSDSTSMLGAIRKLNRLECVGEAIRKVLNDLADLAPVWLKDIIEAHWFDFYCVRFEKYRFPKDKTEQEELAIQIGEDGYYLLTQLDSENTPQYLREIESIKILRQIWLQQYYVESSKVQWRQPKTLGMPPNQLLIQSPFDIEARNRTKRELNWTGYGVHITETCDKNTPNVITNVETTTATTFDGQMTMVIQEHLAQKELLPQEHFVDTSYGGAHNIVHSKEDYQVELITPVSENRSWQSQADGGFSLSDFQINWQEQKAICPIGKTSSSWKQREDEGAKGAIEIRFEKKTCQMCQCRHLCTKSEKNPRILKIRPQKEFEILQQWRQEQDRTEWRKRYNQRAGIEGTISQAVVRFGLRRCRYVGLEKTHLQNIAIACAINLTRVIAWFEGKEKKSTRISHFARLKETG